VDKQQMEDILARVRYKDWTFHVEERGDHLVLQARFPEADLVTGEVEQQHGRKWILSKHMTKSEVVTTAFKAVLTAEEHEVRERFRYRGRMVFGPHFDVDALHEVARRVEVREDPKSVAAD
jgi:hypothetical protein